MKVYVQFAAAMFVANLIIGVLDGSDVSVRMIVKAILAGVIAAVLLALFDRRKSRRVGG